MTLSSWWASARERCVEQLATPSPLLDALACEAASVASSRSVHLAIFVEPFLTFVLEGTKSIESRFSMVRSAPYRQVTSGDLVLLKQAGGPIIGACLVEATWYFAKPDAATRAAIRERFGQALRDDVPGFWDEREDAAYVSLFKLSHVGALHRPITCPKQDRRGWVVLRDRQQLSLLV